jgi:hypothetical protein
LAWPEQIEVVIHPQSIIHSMVQYRDTSVVAQLGTPDMRVPIAYGLSWPERIESGAAALDFHAWRPELSSRLKRCPALSWPAAGVGGALNGPEGTTAVLNAANEVAVAAFLAGASVLTRFMRSTLQLWTRCSPPSRIRWSPCWPWMPGAVLRAQRVLARLWGPDCCCIQELSMLTVALFCRLGLLIAVHEYGHYRVAVACGVKVLRFSVGFGKPCCAGKGKGSPPSLSLACFRWGAMCDAGRARGGGRHHERHLAFNTQPLRSRAAIVAAGPWPTCCWQCCCMPWSTGRCAGAQSRAGQPASGSVAHKAGFAGVSWCSRPGATGTTWSPCVRLKSCAGC